MFIELQQVTASGQVVPTDVRADSIIRLEPVKMIKSENDPRKHFAQTRIYLKGYGTSTIDVAERKEEIRKMAVECLNAIYPKYVTIENKTSEFPAIAIESLECEKFPHDGCIHPIHCHKVNKCEKMSGCKGSVKR